MNRMDKLVREWKSVSRHDERIDKNADLLSFLGSWLYSQYQPFPEKAPFWDRLYDWLDHIKGTEDKRSADQQALFNFVPWLLFAGEEDLIATYRAAYTGPICRWMLKQDGIAIDDPKLDSKLEIARAKTWFGSLAGMNINTFCRVNGIFGQRYRPEFRFIAEFCEAHLLAAWLHVEGYQRIVIVEDIVGTGTQFNESLGAFPGLKDFPILFVPLFIAPEGDDFARKILKKPEYGHVEYDPIFVLPTECLVNKDSVKNESREIKDFRKVNKKHNSGLLGFGKDYGTLVLTNANCPDNVPPIVHKRIDARPVPLFPRASREG